jgi:hypothetical protein
MVGEFETHFQAMILKKHLTTLCGIFGQPTKAKSIAPLLNWMNKAWLKKKLLRAKNGSI